MPSFDIVSEMTMHEVGNAVDNANRDLSNRWDFRNVEASIELNEKNETIKVSSESDFQVQQLIDILATALAKRNIEFASFEVPEEIDHHGKIYGKTITMKQGIEKDIAKKIIKLIKDSKLKVQSQIQGDQIRVTGKSRDDLQSAMRLVKDAELGQPFQFNNFRD